MNCQNDTFGTTTQSYVIGNCTIQQGNQESMAYSTMVAVMYDSEVNSNMTSLEPSFSPISFNYPTVDYSNYTEGWVSSVSYDDKNCTGGPSRVSNNYYGNCLSYEIGNYSWSIMKLLDLGE